jgi:hypothetical protein
MSNRIAVDAEALLHVLRCLNGPPHCIRELQMTRGLPGVDKQNPIDILTNEYNAYVAHGPKDPDLTPEKSAELLAAVLGTEFEPEKAHAIMTVLYAEFIRLLDVRPLRASWPEVYELLIVNGMDDASARKAASVLFPSVTLEQVEVLKNTLDTLFDLQTKASIMQENIDYRTRPWKAIDVTLAQLEAIGGFIRAKNLDQSVRVVQYIDENTIYLHMADGKVTMIDCYGKAENEKAT